MKPPIITVLLDKMRFARLPQPEREVRFHPTRKWRFDIAYPAVKLAIEVEGGVYVQGRHVRGAAFEADAEKYAEALCLGWRVLRLGPNHIRNNDGRAVDWIRRALAVCEA